MLENLNKIEIENPVDLNISQIRNLTSSVTTKPREKLPPERKLAKHIGVSRGQVRDVINRLKFYGIVNVLPQSGILVTGIGLGIVALEGLITDILKIDKSNFKSLVGTRMLVEIEAFCLVALHRTQDDLVQFTIALDSYKKNNFFTTKNFNLL